jgi:hypothetical protein
MASLCQTDWSLVYWLHFHTKISVNHPSTTNWLQEPWRASTPSCTDLSTLRFSLIITSPGRFTSAKRYAHSSHVEWKVFRC